MNRTFKLMVAPNGARRGKADHPALPMTTAEIAGTARACQAEGAQAIHLHIRDADGRHSLDAGRYREAMAAIAETAPGMDIQITTEAAGIYDVAAQYACLDALRPDWASVSVREMAGEPDLAARAYALARETGTRVQHILYGRSCIARFNHWRDSGVIRETRPEVILVLSQHVPPVPALPADLTPLRAPLGRPVDWMVCAFGPYEQACLTEALRQGGHVRIGFENNFRTAQGRPLADNAASVRAFVAAARAEGFTPARPSLVA